MDSNPHYSSRRNHIVYIIHFNVDLSAEPGLERRSVRADAATGSEAAAQSETDTEPEPRSVPVIDPGAGAVQIRARAGQDKLVIVTQHTAEQAPKMVVDIRASVALALAHGAHGNRDHPSGRLWYTPRTD